jgi:hypothetical protein
MNDHMEWVSYSHWGMFALERNPPTIGGQRQHADAGAGFEVPLSRE